MTDRSRIKIEPWVADLVRKDIEDSIKRRDVGSLRDFAAEARASGMLEEARRGFEVAALLESWEAKAGRAELVKIKASLDRVLQPTPEQLVAAFDRDQMSRGAPFSTADYEATEHQRVQVANERLRRMNEQAVEQRRAQVGDEQPGSPWWQ